MEYIRVTKENIEKEHICCAISSNRDIQVISKKNWLKERFDDGLVFLKSIERGNALSSIFRQKMHGIQSWQRVICILTVFGWLVLSKAMVIRLIY